MLSQFHGVKILGVQHASMKCSYYSLFLGIHTKGTQKYSVSQCEMEGQEETLSDRYHKFYRSRASCFRQFTMLSTIFSAISISTIFPAICICINCITFEIANLFFKTEDYKSPDIQRVQWKTLHYLLPSTFAEQCYHIIQFLHSPEIDRCFPDYLNDKHARQNFKRKAERYKWDETRQKLFYPKDDQFKNSNLQFLVIHFYKCYLMYAQEFLLNLDYVCVRPGMLMYLFIRCVRPGISLLLYNSFQSSMFQSLLMKKSNGG